MAEDVWVPGILLFCAGVVASLAASWLLVSRLERLGERAGFSEAWLGLVAALAADAPEITSSVVALARGQASVGAGVIIGSNVFNLAALLGLAAVVAGSIAFHRRVVVLSGVPAVWLAAVCWRRSTRRRPNSPRRSGPGRAPGVTRSPRWRR
jgi:cation:H+ antiporter